MMLHHNKKRNTGLISEFFARYLAKCVVENNDTNLKKAKTILKKYFSEGSELLEELKLFRSVHSSSLVSKENVSLLFSKVKENVKKQDATKLNLEKTSLLHEINHSLGGASFFEEKIENYRDLATTQYLFNYWREESKYPGIFAEMIKLEENLSFAVLSEGQKRELNTKENPLARSLQENVDRLVVGIFEKKLAEKFSGSLSESQRNLLNLFVLGEKDLLEKELESIETKTKKLIKETALDEALKHKLETIQGTLNESVLKEEKGEEKRIAFYMSLIQLNEELEQK